MSAEQAVLVWCDRGGGCKNFIIIPADRPEAWLRVNGWSKAYPDRDLWLCPGPHIT